MQKTSTSLEIDKDILDLLYDKYYKLMYTICHKVSGDPAICDVEDTFQELHIKLIESAKAFSKRVNKPLKECLEDPQLGQYIKTCLWNFKNYKGKMITKHYPILKSVVPIAEDNSCLQVEDLTFSSMSIENYIFIDELKRTVNPQQKKIIECIMNDHSLIKANGKINVSKLSKLLNIPWYDTQREIDSMASFIKFESA